MIIECPHCEATVDGAVLFQYEIPRGEPWEQPIRTVLLKCPRCASPLLGNQELTETEDGEMWLAPERLWPSPKRVLAWSLPLVVRFSLEEADRCLRAGAFTASAVMSGRALEGVCRHYKTKSMYLGEGLKQLLAAEVIDKRLFEWGQALQLHRNIGAHATEERISKADALDLLEFSIAICDYVFVLSEKFTEFKARLEKAGTTRTKSKAKVKVAEPGEPAGKSANPACSGLAALAADAPVRLPRLRFPDAGCPSSSSCTALLKAPTFQPSGVADNSTPPNAHCCRQAFPSPHFTTSPCPGLRPPLPWRSTPDLTSHRRPNRARLRSSGGVRGRKDAYNHRGQVVARVEVACPFGSDA